MQIFYNLDAIEDDGRPVYGAMGNFDGVHRGHQALLGRLQAAARQGGASTLAITFDPHPLHVLRPEAAPPLLTTIEERAYRLARLGIDFLQVIPFDRQFAATPAEDFVRHILARRFRVRRLFGGAFFTFGHQRQGNVELIRRLAPETGCQVSVVDPLPWQGGPISSTVIRRLVAAGQVDAASDLLGAPFVLQGQVQRGEGRGRSLGIPTANLPLSPQRAQPAHGVYAVHVCVRGQVVAGVANLGSRPTFAGQGAPPVLEVHLFDWEQSLYGETLRIAFVQHLRPERRFPGVNAFLAQVRLDMDRARALLAQRPLKDRGYLCLAS